MRDFQEQASKYVLDTFGPGREVRVSRGDVEVAFLKGVAAGLHHAADELRELRDDIGKLTKDQVSSREHTS